MHTMKSRCFQKLFSMCYQSALIQSPNSELCMPCLFCLISTKTLHVYLIYTQTKARFPDWKNIAFIQFLFFFTHAATATQLINVEATIVRARVVSKRLALKYPWQSILLTTLMWNKQKWNTSNTQTMANQPTKINNAAMHATNTDSDSAHHGTAVEIRWTRRRKLTLMSL